MKRRDSVFRTAVGFLALSLAAPRQAAAQAARVVTFITGDRVVVGGASGETVTIRPGPGREKMRFSTLRLAPRAGQRPHLFVIPEDAASLIAADKVDRRLFDVSLLLEFAYDDAQREDLPVIVSYAGGGPAARGAALAQAAPELAGAVVGQQLDSINSVAASLAKARAHELWSSVVAGNGSGAGSVARSAAAAAPLRKLWLDGLRKPNLDLSVPQIGAPLVWNLGYEGDGIVVAVLDSGVDETHPDLVDKIIVSRNFTEVTDLDEVGHGTHVASIIAGSGAAQGSRYRGVAPGVQLLSGKVCESQFYCPESSIIAGAQWAVVEEGARVVNISLGGDDTPGLDPVEEAISTLSADHDALFVLTAGNSGPGPQTIEAPGSVGVALTIGAADRDEQVAAFSSRGPSVDGQTLKPDLLAPGVDIVAARAQSTTLGVPVGEWYVAASGTSMAAPHAAGAAALLLQAHPEWSAEEVKSALMSSARFNPAFTALDQGAGFLDVAAALATNVMTDTPSISFGTARWPHDDGEILTHEVTFRNLGPAVELVLELDVSAPDGSRPPREMFTLDPSVLQLPAAGMAAATVTVDSGVAAPYGVYSGRLIASDGAGRALSVPLVVEREAESYDLTLRHLDREGAPTSQWFGFFVRLDSPAHFSDYVFPPPDGQDLTLRFPAGKYAVQVSPLEAEGTPTFSLAPNQVLDRNKLLVFDARAGVAADFQTPKAQAERIVTVLSWELPAASGKVSGSFDVFGAPIPTYYGAIVGPPAPELSSVVSTQWLDSSSGTPVLYAGAWTERGKLPTGVKAMNLQRSAVVHARYEASLSAATDLEYDIMLEAALGTNVASLSTFFVDLPYERTEYYYSPDSALRWTKWLFLFSGEHGFGTTFEEIAPAYRAGRTYTSRWNSPPFSPALPEATRPLWGAYRAGDTLDVLIPMYADREGHVSNGGALEPRFALYREGELIGESVGLQTASFDVPRRRARYRLEATHSQELFELTPRQTAAWEFESAHTKDSARLPLLMFRFDPELNEQGRAKRQRLFRLPFSVDQYGSERPPSISQLIVEVSYDDGVSWRRVPVTSEGEHWSAHLDHARASDYVSLRAFARDRRGNSVEQTLIRAYGVATR
jgi:subtilisin family serine protease